MKFFEKNKEKRQGVSVIGIAGTDRNVGSTHTAILFGNYLASIQNKSVAILEFNQCPCFGELISVAKVSIKNLDFYSQVSRKEASIIFCKNYDYIIYDFGALDDFNKDEFYKCSEKFIVGYYNYWNQSKYNQFVQSNKDYMNYKKWSYLIAYGDKDKEQLFFKKHQIVPKSLPLVTNPFQVEHVYINEIRDILMVMQ